MHRHRHRDGNLLVSMVEVMMNMRLNPRITSDNYTRLLTLVGDILWGLVDRVLVRVVGPGGWWRWGSIAWTGWERYGPRRTVDGSSYWGTLDGHGGDGAPHWLDVDGLRVDQVLRRQILSLSV